MISVCVRHDRPAAGTRPIALRHCLAARPGEPQYPTGCGPR